MLNVAILGCGNIANKVCKTIEKIDGFKIYCVAARDKNRAEDFAKLFGVEKFYGSYEDMVKDDLIDLVYVTTPHSLHYNHIKLCLDSNRHVLCEKAFTVNEAQAIFLIELARRNNLLLAEAIWSRYLPAMAILRETLESKLIGEPLSLVANIGFRSYEVERIKNKDLGGGALLDIGVYLLNFARVVFNKPIKKISGEAIQTQDNVDLTNTIYIEYENNAVAVLHATTFAATNKHADIFCSDGYIEIDNVINPKKIEVFTHDGNLIKSLDIPKQISGYEYQFLSCANAISGKKTECAEMPHSEITYIMQSMDKLRAGWNYNIPDIR